jgi:putative CocE/NonD family hydrolase
MRNILVVILIFVGFSASAQDVDSTWVVTHYTKKEIYIPMRDGIKLFTAVYIPLDSSEKHPILFIRTPYSCAPYGADHFTKFWRSYQSAYIREGYIMVYQDVRGRWMSEGNFENVRPFNPNKKGKETDEASDTYDAIDWMIKNISSNNGNVGVMGISYPGFYATEAALSAHPALKAVSPQAPVTDWFAGDDIHHNGAFFMMDAFDFYVGYGFGKPRPTPVSTNNFKPLQVSTHDKYDYYLQVGALPNLTAIADRDSIYFWDTLMNHPNYDAFWRERNARVGCYNVKPAMLEVGGLFDAEDCFGTWGVFKAIEKQSPSTSNRIVEGPWYHGQWSSIVNKGNHLGNIQFGSNTSIWYEQNVEVPFFNYYLKNEGSLDNLSKVTIFFTGENKWHRFNTWPPAGVEMKDIFLEDDNKLSFAKPASNGSFSEYISDPAHAVPYADGELSHRTTEYMDDDQRFASNRTDVLSFGTDTLKEDVTLAGTVTSDLKVSLSTTDADFIVKLIDVFPGDFKYSDTDKYVMNGYQMLVRAQIMRGKFRNSLEKPEPFVPGKITEVKYVMPDVAHVFKKGHRIMVQIQSSWFPLVDRNPQQFLDIYHASNSDFIKSDIKIYHNAVSASKLILPVLK